MNRKAHKKDSKREDEEEIISVKRKKISRKIDMRKYRSNEDIGGGGKGDMG